LIFAKGKKLLEFFEEVVMKGLTEYVEIFIFLSVSFDQTFLFKRKVWWKLYLKLGFILTLKP
jgi:hypothetical protein